MARPTWWPFLRADLLAVAAVVNWGLSYGLTKLALAQWRPLTFTGTRFVAMALIAATVLRTQGRLHVLVGPDRARFLLGGLLGFTLYQLGFVLGLDRTSALSSTLLLATIPLFSLLFLRLGGSSACAVGSGRGSSWPSSASVSWSWPRATRRGWPTPGWATGSASARPPALPSMAS